jgi:hypothetical protein
MRHELNRRTAGKTQMPDVDLMTLPRQTSPLVLSDRLIRLAQEADRAGLAITARRLVRLACSVLDERATEPPLSSMLRS